MSTIVLGQGISLSLGSGSATPGGSVSVPVSITSTGGAQAAAVQWSFNFSADISGVTVVIGSAASSAQKAASCNGNTCLIYGLNQNIIANGVVATATFQVAPGASAQSVAVQLTSIVAATALGVSIPATSIAGAISVETSAVLSGVGCAAGSIATPGSTPCSVSLSSAAPVGGFLVSLSSNNANLVVPPTVTVAAGQSTATFSATATQVSADQMAVVAANSGSVTLSVTLNLAAPGQLTGLSCSPASLPLNASATCTISFSASVASPAMVSLSSNSAAVTVPGGATVPLGQSGTVFQATSATVVGSQTAVITASFNGQTRAFTLVVSAAVPTAVSVTPSAAAGLTQTFSFVFADSQNSANLSAAAILFSPSLVMTNSCFVIYDRNRATIQLQWDGLTGTNAKPINSITSLQNSQCTVGATSLTASSLSITITVDITFKSGFSGPKNIYMYAAATAGSINTGWVQKGTYSVTPVSTPVPSVDSVTPDAGSGLSQSFNFVISDSHSAANLSAAAILIAPSPALTNACFLIYDVSRGTIQLQWDNIMGNVAKPINSAGGLQNSQCVIGATSITTSDLSVTLTIQITFKSAFSGLKNLYMYAADGDGTVNTGWVQKGTYAVTPISAPMPSADSVTPSGGIGSSQTFSFVFSDTQSAANLSAAAILIAPSLIYPDSCFVIYDRNRGTIQLEWDNMAGAVAKPVNSTSTLQNSQCTIGTTSLTTTALSITLAIQVTFKSTFSGLKNIYMYGAVTDGTINTGWVQKGTWTSF